jgi:hypothetical protein
MLFTSHERLFVGGMRISETLSNRDTLLKVVITTFSQVFV